MPSIFFVQSDGVRLRVDADIGASVMRTALDHRVNGIVAECGGSCACGTCHVYVDEAFLPLLQAPAADEKSLLEFTAAERRSNSRLSCQIVIDETLEGAVFVIPDRQL